MKKTEQTAPVLIKGFERRKGVQDDERVRI